jgi:hypothetical protein
MGIEHSAGVELLTKAYVARHASVIKSQHWSDRKTGFLFVKFTIPRSEETWMLLSYADLFLDSETARRVCDHVNAPRSGRSDDLLVVGYGELVDAYALESLA